MSIHDRTSDYFPMTCDIRACFQIGMEHGNSDREHCIFLIYRIYTAHLVFSALVDVIHVMPQWQCQNCMLV